MTDLAEIAGVSVTTVSHVLNDSRTVREATRLKVLAAASEIGYSPNILARSMKTATSSTIGLAAPALSKVALAELVRPIEAHARARSLSLLLTDTEDEPGPELAAVRALYARRVDGIIIAPSGPDAPALDFLREHGIPTVVVDRFTSGHAFDQVGTENVRATERLTDHLVETGHTRIAMLCGMPSLSTTVERIRGYRRSLRRHGLQIDVDLVRMTADDPAAYLPVLRALLTSPSRPTAVVSGNSSTTIGLMRASGAMGLRVPDDLALVGFDDFDWADVFHPRLTVVRQRMEEIGTLAVDLLERRIAEPNLPTRTRRLAADFVHRDSCGCRGRGARPSRSSSLNGQLPAGGA